jgi:hypothetical protein
MRLASLISTAIVGSTVWIACSSGEEQPGTSSGVASSSSGGIAPITGGTDPNSFAKCGETRQGATLLPIHLAVSLDKSTSMCEVGANPQNRDCQSSNSKWQQSKSALRTFFTNPVKDVSGMTLITWSSPKNNIRCSNVFDTALFQLTPGKLLDFVLFEASMGTPEPDNYTPTSAAIDGAVRHAQSLNAKLDGGKAVSILVTDGLPTTCPGNGFPADVPNALKSAVAACEKAKAQGQPMYVIGVGKELDNLNQIANACGTPLFLVNVDNPGQISQDLVAALEKIRVRSTGCQLKIPNGKGGAQLDYSQVNVTTFSSGKETLVPYSQNCSTGKGWRYDTDPKAGKPSRIELCGAACDEIKQDAKAELKLVVGCKSQTLVN